MKCTRKETQSDRLTVGNINTDQVRSFSYLGTTANGNNTLEEEIIQGTVKGNIAFYANRTLFKTNLVSRKCKLKLYWSVIRPTVVYGCETWVLKESTIQRLSVCERKIFGPTKEDNGIWRIKTNKELDESIKHRNIINYFKARN
jgi:hypothetical protein